MSNASAFVRRRGDDQVRAAFRDLGAVTPANARPRKEFPAFDTRTFDRLLRRGVIREGAPGAFYLYQPPPLPKRWGLRILIAIAVLGLPLAILQFCPGSP